MTIERLEEGEPLPAGATEATLVLSNDEKTITVVDVVDVNVPKAELDAAPIDVMESSL